MFHSLRNLKIKTRIKALLFLPILGLIVISGLAIVEKWQLVSNMRQLGDLVKLANHLSRAVHELQKERGMTAVFLNSQGKQMADSLSQQRQVSDKSRAELKLFLAGFDAKGHGAGLSNELARTLELIDGIDGRREQINQLAIPPAEGFAFYTGVNMQAIKTIAQIALTSNNIDTSNAISAYVGFLYGKEKTGQERAIGAGGLTAGRFTEDGYRRFAQTTAEQSVYLSIFENYAPDAIKSFLAQTVAGREVEEAARIRKLLLAGGLAGDLKGTEVTYWFKVMTTKIDLMKKVEDKLASSLESIAEDESGKAETALLTTLIGVLVLLTFTTGLGTIIVRGITGPAARITDAMSQLAGGDKTVEVDGADNRDEFGAMARAVVIFKQKMIRGDELAAKEAESLRARETRAKVVEDLTDAFDFDVADTLKMVRAASSGLHSTATTMTTTAGESKRQAAAAASATEQTSANVQTMAASAEELSNSINEIGQQVTQSAAVARRAVTEAAQTNETVQGLAQSAERIGAVVKLIQEVASQTNLLALNATIEAARAGDSGRGFAVVASEVKSLASQTEKATEEIAGQIAAIQSASAQAVQAIQGISSTIGEISEIATTITMAVEKQGEATQEIARNVQQAAQASHEVANNLSGMTSAASDAGAAAHQVLASSDELSRQSEALQLRVEAFLHRIKAA